MRPPVLFPLAFEIGWRALRLVVHMHLRVAVPTHITMNALRPPTTVVVLEKGSMPTAKYGVYDGQAYTWLHPSYLASSAPRPG